MTVPALPLMSGKFGGGAGEGGADVSRYDQRAFDDVAVLEDF